jgi:hypothetical protein
LINDGQGRFTDAATPNLARVGLVTSALWSDADNDGWLDLFVTLDWGPVMLFHNQAGALTPEPAYDLHGWWNGIAAADLDHDGDLDYVVTNFGFNTKYRATPEKPELLFYGDLDGSGKSNIVEAKFIDGEIFPRRGFSCSQNAMPFIKTKLRTFHNFASATLAGIYGEDRVEKATRFTAETLANGVLLNDGRGRFTFEELPRLAQIAPAFGVVLSDFDGDGHCDCVLAQNFFTPQRETERMDGGLGLFLKGDGAGHFTAVWPAESGIVIPGDQKSLALTDLNGDAAPDLFLAENNGPLHALTTRSDGRFLAVRLKGNALGARVTFSAKDLPTQTAEVAAGGSYLSQSSPTVFFGLGRATADGKIDVRWPDGTTSRQAVPAGQGVQILTHP